MPSLQSKDFVFTRNSVSSPSIALDDSVSKFSDVLRFNPLGGDDIGVWFVKAHNNGTNYTLPTNSGSSGTSAATRLQGSRDGVDWCNITSLNLGTTPPAFMDTNQNYRLSTSQPIPQTAFAVVQLMPYMRLSVAGIDLAGQSDTKLSSYIAEA